MSKTSKWNKESGDQKLTASDYMTYRFKCSDSTLKQVGSKTSVTYCKKTQKPCTVSNCYRIK